MSIQLSPTDSNKPPAQGPMSIPLYLVTVSLIVTLVRAQDNLDVRLFCKDLPEEQVTCGEELEQRFNKATEVRFFISLYI